MKKFFVILLTICTTLAFSQAVESSSNSIAPKKIPTNKLSNTTYQLVPIVKIYNTKDFYFVLYRGGEWNIEKVAFPKEWFKQGNPLGTMRKTPPKMDAFLTIFYTDGKFSNVILTTPSDAHNSVWGILENTDISQYVADESFVLQY